MPFEVVTEAILFASGQSGSEGNEGGGLTTGLGASSESELQEVNLQISRFSNPDVSSSVAGARSHLCYPFNLLWCWAKVLLALLRFVSFLKMRCRSDTWAAKNQAITRFKRSSSENVISGIKAGKAQGGRNPRVSSGREGRDSRSSSPWLEVLAIRFADWAANLQNKHKPLQHRDPPRAHPDLHWNISKQMFLKAL